ncbi:MAG: PP2C family protein-serine/threonine phosphatase [Capsulimonadaceae bacterium]
MDEANTTKIVFGRGRAGAAPGSPSVLRSGPHHEYHKASNLPVYVITALLAVMAEVVALALDQALGQVGFPWTAVSILLLCAVAVLLGVRPALVLLIVSDISRSLILPYIHARFLSQQPVPLEVHLIRAVVYALCGGAVIRLAHQAQTTRETGERKQDVLLALQTMVAPDRLASVRGWDVAALYQPARAEEEVGGDFYDFFALHPSAPHRDDDEFAPGIPTHGLIVGDVMGKGKEAATHTAMLRYSARAYAAVGDSPAMIMQRLNALLDAEPQDLTTSLFYGELDARTGALRYASAGHEPPLLIHASGTVDELSATGPILGCGFGASYTEASTQIHPGDSLMLMTDGVTESRDPKGQFLNAAGAVRLLRNALGQQPAVSRRRSSLSGRDAAIALTHIAAELRSFTAGNNRDDTAMLLLCRDFTD